MPPAIYTDTAGANGLFVNSYLVETDDGVVAIDAGLLVSDALEWLVALSADAVAAELAAEPQAVSS
jgi:hypothetical protein